MEKNESTWSSSLCSVSLMQLHIILFYVFLFFFFASLFFAILFSSSSLVLSNVVAYFVTYSLQMKWCPPFRPATNCRSVSVHLVSHLVPWRCGSICNLLACFGAFRVHSVDWFIKNWHESLNLFMTQKWMALHLYAAKCNQFREWLCCIPNS